MLPTLRREILTTQGLVLNIQVPKLTESSDHPLIMDVRLALSLTLTRELQAVPRQFPDKVTSRDKDVFIYSDLVGSGGQTGTQPNADA
ncbi:hypothetical protein J6590_066159 [Homalodisca vitripennis]|nr:hypothetical protein J6590_066159 [Homalodisca vitripennis]